MPYEINEGGLNTGAPVWFYVFRVAGETFRFTSFQTGITLDGEVYLPRQIGHGETALTGEVAKDSLKLTMPIFDDFARGLLAPGGSLQAATVTILRAHYADVLAGAPDLRTVWKGRIAQPTMQGGQVEIGCEPVWSAQKRAPAMVPYSIQCPYSLFMTYCHLQKENHRIEAEINHVDRAVVYLQYIPAAAVPLLPDGSLEDPNTGEERKIWATSLDGLTLTLSRPLPSLSALNPGDIVHLYPGCDRSPRACRGFANPHNQSGTNIENFGGFLWMPTEGKNPFTGTYLL